MTRTTGLTAMVAACALVLGANAATAGGDKYGDKDQSAQQGAMGNGEQGAMGNGEAPKDASKDAKKDWSGKTKDVTAQKVLDKPDKWYGKSVSITAPVQALHGKQVFALGTAPATAPGAQPPAASAPADPKQQLLVLLPKELTKNVTPQQQVTIEGTLREFVDADIYIDHDVFTADDVAVAYRSMPVLVARKITTQDGIALLAPSGEPERAMGK